MKRPANRFISSAMRAWRWSPFQASTCRLEMLWRSWPAARSACARRAGGLETTVQIGENSDGAGGLYTAFQMKACDYVMPDFMRIGGVTGWQRAAAIAAAAGIPISTHLYPEVAAHMMRVSETAHLLEW